MTESESRELAGMAAELCPKSRSNATQIAALAIALEDHPPDVAKRAILAHSKTSEFISLPGILARIDREIYPERLRAEIAAAKARAVAPGTPPADPTVRHMREWAESTSPDVLERLRDELLASSNSGMRSFYEREITAGRGMGLTILAAIYPKQTVEAR